MSILFKFIIQYILYPPRFRSTMSTRSKDPLGLELELNVTEDDLDSLDYDLRPPLVCGMPCPVLACSAKPYQSINTIWKHWKKVHT